MLNPAIMPEVDCNSNTLNAELEVKKLQELVRKLERQNEQLRTRAGGCLGVPALPLSPPYVPGNAGGYRPSQMPELLCHSSLACLLPQDELLEYFQPYTVEDGAAEEVFEEAVLDELELLDLDSMCSPDDSQETWLYVSQKSTDSSGDSLTPLQWCRQVLDSPKSELEASRRSLSLRLEQVSRWRSSLSSPSHSSPPSLSRVAGVSPISASPSAKPCSTPQSERHAPSLSSPLHPVLHRTLSPVGKDLSPVAERTPTFLPHLSNRSRSLQHSVLTPQSSVEDEDSISLGYKLQDLTDVQVMARLQEESLRQDLALSSRRSHSFTFPLSQLSAAPGLEEEDEEDDEDYGLLPPPQPRLTRLSHSHTFSSFRDWPRGSSSLCTPPSTPSTPSHPSAGFAFHTPASAQPLGLGLGSPSAEQGFRPGSDKLRRSMPNLVRTPSVPFPTTPSASPSLLRSSLSFDSSSGLARLQSSIPSPGQLQTRVQSVGNFTSLSRPPLKATAYVSPTIKSSSYLSQSSSLQSLSSSSGIPLLNKPTGNHTPARSSLPRPASFIGTSSSTPRNKLAQSGRSLLTPPKSLSTFSALRDSAWRDGCY